MKKYLEEATKIDSWLKTVYQNLHTCPEVGLEEFKTKNQIINYLDEIGINYTTFKNHTGIMAYIIKPENTTTIGLRADIDGLPIVENNEFEFKSQNNGMMHACGHDAHTTTLLGACRLLHKMRDDLKVNVKFFFQPAEETDGGAQRMIDDGCMKNPKVDRTFGLHVAPLVESGKIEVRYDTMNASTDTITVKIHGQKAHGAYPHQGVDAIVCAAQVITSLQTIVSRNIDPMNSVVLTIGVIHGGVRSNIICEEVEFEATLRALNEETRQYATNRIKQIIEHTCTGLETTCSIEIERGYDALVNNNDMVDLVYENACDLLSKENVLIKKEASLGAEDFSFFLNHSKGAFFHLGCGNISKGYTSPLHTSEFKVDQDCLKVGTAMHVANVMSFNKE